MTKKKEYSWTEGLKEVEVQLDTVTVAEAEEDREFSKWIKDNDRFHFSREFNDECFQKEKEFNKLHKRTMKIVNDFVTSVSMWVGAVDAVDYATMMYLFTLFRYKEIEWEKLEMVLDDPKLGRAMLLQSLVAYVNKPPVEEEYD